MNNYKSSLHILSVSCFVLPFNEYILQMPEHTALSRVLVYPTHLCIETVYLHSYAIRINCFVIDMLHSVSLRDRLHTHTQTSVLWNKNLIVIYVLLD